MSMKVSVVKWERNYDLRKISTKRLLDAGRFYRLREHSAVLFTNSTYSRARLLVKIDGLPVLITFPSDEKYTVMGSMFMLAVKWVHRRSGMIELNDKNVNSIREAA